MIFFLSLSLSLPLSLHVCVVCSFSARSKLSLCQEHYILYEMLQVEVLCCVCIYVCVCVYPNMTEKTLGIKQAFYIK